MTARTPRDSTIRRGSPQHLGVRAVATLADLSAHVATPADIGARVAAHLIAEVRYSRTRST